MDIAYNPHRVIELLTQQIAELTKENAMLVASLEVLSQQVQAAAVPAVPG